MFGALAGLLASQGAKTIAGHVGISLAANALGNAIFGGDKKNDVEQAYLDASQSVQNFNNQVQR